MEQLSEVQKIDQKGVLLPRCSFCGRVPEEGIRGGLKLHKVFVCRECERTILSVEIGSPAYEQLLETIKQIFRSR